MNKEITSKREVLRLGLVYCGLLALLCLLPENNPTINGLVLGVYAMISFLIIEHKS